VHGGGGHVDRWSADVRQPELQPFARPEPHFAQDGEACSVDVENPEGKPDRHQLALDAQQRVHSRGSPLVARLPAQCHAESRRNSYANARGPEFRRHEAAGAAKGVHAMTELPA
jgi:hypothetical protein